MKILSFDIDVDGGKHRLVNAVQIALFFGTKFIVCLLCDSLVI